MIQEMTMENSANTHLSTEKSLVIAGFGGQGVLLCGRIIANIFMLNGKKVTWYPCYGSEMRGGAVNCEIVVSDEEVTSVHKKQTDILLTLNDISYNRFLPQVKDGGIIIANTSLIKEIKEERNIKYIKADITDKAGELGNIKVTNMVALGLLSTLFNNVDFSQVSEIIKDMLPKNKSDLIELNLKAFKAGTELRGERI